MSEPVSSTTVIPLPTIEVSGEYKLQHGGGDTVDDCYQRPDGCE